MFCVWENPKVFDISRSSQFYLSQKYFQPSNRIKIKSNINTNHTMTNQTFITSQDADAAQALLGMSRKRRIPYSHTVISKRLRTDEERMISDCDRDMNRYIKHATRTWFYVSNQILNSIAKDVSKIKSHHFKRKHKVQLYKKITQEEVDHFQRTCWGLFNRSN